MIDGQRDPAERRAARIEGDAGPDGPVLALETATTQGSAAVGRSGRLLAEVIMGVEVRHSESLLPAVRFALERARLGPADLRAVVVGAGPGSFTGVRIAGATAKGIVHALDIPLYAYSSLAGLAAGTGVAGRPVCAVIDAHRDEVFAACYRFAAGAALETLLEPSVMDVNGLAERLSPESPLWVGAAALRFAGILEHHGELAGAPLAVPRASSLLWLAREWPAAGRIADPAAWTPDYVRPPGATRPA